nr:uncharacterized protein LOC107279728 [Oryza sativa Japonica Group]
MYLSTKLATHMRWHKEKLVDDGYKRHPANSKEWKDFDGKFSSFALDARNIRLGLASDGFNPFGNMSSSYSIWTVVLVIYNLPPWMCMKDPYMVMSMIILGPKAPGISTKGKYACPSCHTETCYHRLVNGHKYCYMGHRRFLPRRHVWRNNDASFDGQKEKRSAPKPLSEDDIISQYEKFEQVKFGKSGKKRKHSSTLYGT